MLGDKLSDQSILYLSCSSMKNNMFDSLTKNLKSQRKEDETRLRHYVV